MRSATSRKLSEGFCRIDGQQRCEGSKRAGASALPDNISACIIVSLYPPDLTNTHVIGDLRKTEKTALGLLQANCREGLPFRAVEVSGQGGPNRTRNPSASALAHCLAVMCLAPARWPQRYCCAALVPALFRPKRVRTRTLTSLRPLRLHFAWLSQFTGLAYGSNVANAGR